MRHTIGAALVGIVLFGLSSSMPNVQLLDERNVGDTHLYRTYGENVRDGQVPYDDFYVEYPPGAIAAFVAPTIGPEEHYGQHSKWLQWLLGAATIVLLAVTLNAVGRGRLGLYLATAFVGVAPVALGRVTFTRYDLWPAALTAAALALAVHRRNRLAAVALAIGTAAKVYPAVLVPLVLVRAWRQSGRREAARVAATYAATLLAIVAPFAVLAPGGVGYSLSVQLDRPLQIESVGSSLLLAAGQLGLYDPSVETSHGSQNLAGSVPAVLAVVTSLLLLGGLAAVWYLFVAGPGRSADLLAAAAAAVFVFATFGKVLSPQYLLWLVPVAALVRGRRGMAVALLLLAALVLTQGWSQGRYGDVVELEPVVWLVVARDFALVVASVLLVREVAASVRDAGTQNANSATTRLR